MMDPFLKRVALRNYKSIASCDVELPPLCFLVGRNGAGKSNFLDALRLVSDALYTSLDSALRERGGLHAVCRQPPGILAPFHIHLEFRLPQGQAGFYAINVGWHAQLGYEVKYEECSILPAGAPSQSAAAIHYRVRSGKVESSSIPTPPAAHSDRLYLVNASGFEEFRPIYDYLSRMGFYNLSPEAIRNAPANAAGLVLKHDGSNIASVLANMQKNAPQTKARVEEFLAAVIPEIQKVDSVQVPLGCVLEFSSVRPGSQGAWPVSFMSDGTLRALGILVALFQSTAMPENPTPLIGIEEPENALHPGAAGVLRDALRAASKRTQVLVTTHSPDLLDDKDIQPASLLAVSNLAGSTILAPLDEASRSAIRNRLYTAGELLRTDQLEADPEQVHQQEAATGDSLRSSPQ